MATKKPLINKDRFKSLSQIAKRDDSDIQEGLVSRFETDTQGIAMIELDKLIDAPNEWNFYAKLPDDKFLELVESIYNNTLLHPIVVWEQENGYMILSGHNRARAYEKLYEIEKDEKYSKIPAIVKKTGDIDKETAQEIIVDTNWVQRQLSSYEKTNSILQKYVKTKKVKPKGVKTRDILAKQLGISGRMVQNYLSLNELDKEFFAMIDENVINIKQAVLLAKFSSQIQKEILKHKDLINYDTNLIKKAISIKEPSKVIELLTKNEQEQEYITVSYKIPKEKKLEFDKIYKEFISKK